MAIFVDIWDLQSPYHVGPSVLQLPLLRCQEPFCLAGRKQRVFPTSGWFRHFSCWLFVRAYMLVIGSVLAEYLPPCQYLCRVFSLFFKSIGAIMCINAFASCPSCLNMPLKKVVWDFFYIINLLGEHWVLVSLKCHGKLQGRTREYPQKEMLHSFPNTFRKVPLCCIFKNKIGGGDFCHRDSPRTAQIHHGVIRRCWKGVFG